MRVPYEEGLANQLDSESCTGVGNGVGDALTGGCAGGVLSLEIRAKLLGANVVLTHGRQHVVPRKGEGCADLARSETPGMHRRTLRGTRESPRVALAAAAGVRTVNLNGGRP